MAHVGLIGLGVMGRNLALNLADHGMTVVGYDPDAPVDALPHGVRVSSVKELVDTLPEPRTILLLVPAGDTVDLTLAALKEMLSPSDMVVDGGNSHFRDTMRRAGTMPFSFLGMGISGGAKGARMGPSLMADNDSLQPVFAPIAAKVDGKSCFGSFGGSGAGHFVKMIHNGIEYADMQLIAEAVYLLRYGSHLEPMAIAELLTEWNNGPLSSYLMEITSHILAVTDNTIPFIDRIVDEAGQKGTGHWSVTASMELGVPVPCLSEAVNARNLSVQRPVRDVLQRPMLHGTATAADIHGALRVGRICAYAQGFSVLAAASRTNWSELNLSCVAATWRAGCIIRSRLLDDIQTAFTSAPSLPSLLLAPSIATMLATTRPNLLRAIQAAQNMNLPVPVMSAALSYLNGLSAARLGADVIQAQRDYFGAHGFRLLGCDGPQHGPWQ